jgi:hypothetical protein
VIRDHEPSGVTRIEHTSGCCRWLKRAVCSCGWEGSFHDEANYTDAEFSGSYANSKASERTTPPHMREWEEHVNTVAPNPNPDLRTVWLA